MEHTPNQPSIAYLSAEFGLTDELPIYSGGLGVLAADILKQANDSSLPLVGIGLFYQEGFFKQHLDTYGNQLEESLMLNPIKVGLQEVLDPITHTPLLIKIDLPQEEIAVKVWKKQIGQVPLYLLDTDIPQNKEFEQEYMTRLYDTDWPQHLAQDILLGVGGVRLMRTLNLPIRIWHINDDHPALALLELLREKMTQGKTFEEATREVGKQTVFTTHTPVRGAESLFSPDFIWPYLECLFEGLSVSKNQLLKLGGLDLPDQKNFSFTILALRLAGKINAVSKRHQQVSQKLWHFAAPKKTNFIKPITNGVHVPTWVAPPLHTFYQKYLGEDYWSKIDDASLWSKINNRDLWHARQECKKTLLDKTGITLEPLLIGFARRFTPYKRAHLLLQDLNRLSKILTNPQKPVYLFLAGKAHPKDAKGKDYLHRIFEASQNPQLKGHLIFLANYDLNLAKVLIPGVDLWLNTPLPPMEACGTSGMKALYNGVLNLSIADGWWYEVENQNQVGWRLGSKEPDLENPISDQETAHQLYDLLENEVVPLYYQQENGLPLKWLEKIKTALVQLGPQFNSQRMLREYQSKLYTTY